MMRRLCLFSFFFVPFGWGFQVTSEVEKIISFDIDYYGVWRETLSDLKFVTLKGGQSVYERLPYEYVSGMRAFLEWNIDSKDSLEAIYVGCLNWNHMWSTKASSNAFMVPTAPYTTTDWASFADFFYDYQAKFNSGELSYWRHITVRYADWFSFSWMLGGRYIDLRDSLHMTIQTGNRKDTGYTQVMNRMWGGQGGVEFLISPTKWFACGFQVKGGIFADCAARKTLFNDLGNTVVAVSSQVKRTLATGLLAWTPYVKFWLNPFYLTIAYDGMRLFKPVLAPSQIKAQKEINRIYAHKYTDFNGLYVGLGFAW